MNAGRIVALALVVASVSAQCAWDVYDLSALQGQSFVLSAANGVEYALSPCSNTACGSGTQTGTLTQFRTNPRQCVHMIAKWNGPQFAPLDPANPNAGVSVTFGNGDQCSVNGVFAPMQALINMPCSDDPGSTFTVTTDSTGCSVTVTFPTSAACVPGSARNKLSGGSIFLIALLAVSFAYVLFGCVYKRVAKGTTTARESCPNSEFWWNLPGLVGDGCRFAWGKLTCRSAPSYDTMA